MQENGIIGQFIGSFTMSLNQQIIKESRKLQAEPVGSPLSGSKKASRRASAGILTPTSGRITSPLASTRSTMKGCMQIDNYFNHFYL